MTRNRRSAKDAGTRMEQAAASYLGVERRTKRGAKDRGDLAGLFIRGHRVVAEVKSVATMALPAWLREAAVERDNDDATVGIVIHKRRGVDEVRRPGAQYVTMTLADFAWILGLDVDPREDGEA